MLNRAGSVAVEEGLLVAHVVVGHGSFSCVYRVAAALQVVAVGGHSSGACKQWLLLEQSRVAAALHMVVGSCLEFLGQLLAPYVVMGGGCSPCSYGWCLPAPCMAVIGVAGGSCWLLLCTWVQTVAAGSWLVLGSN